MASITQPALLEALATEEQRIDALLKRIDDTQWTTLQRADGWSLGEIFGHLGDSAYGMAFLAEKGQPTEGVPLGADGRVDIDALNEQRRQKHLTMNRAQIERRVQGGIAEAQRVIGATTDDAMGGPGPFGPQPTKGEWLNRLILHIAQHREEIEAAIGS